MWKKYAKNLFWKWSLSWFLIRIFFCNLNCKNTHCERKKIKKLIYVESCSMHQFKRHIVLAPKKFWYGTSQHWTSHRIISPPKLLVRPNEEHPFIHDVHLTRDICILTTDVGFSFKLTVHGVMQGQHLIGWKILNFLTWACCRKHDFLWTIYFQTSAFFKQFTCGIQVELEN
jgi:hypothetical protein